MLNLKYKVAANRSAVKNVFFVCVVFIFFIIFFPKCCGFVGKPVPDTT